MKVDFKGASSCGLAVGLFSVVMSLITMYPLRTIVAENTMISILFSILGIAAFVAVLWYFKKHYVVDGVFTYGAGIKAGILIGSFWGIVAGAFMYCIFAFDTDYVNYVIEVSKKAIAAMPIPPEAAQQALENIKTTTTPNYMAVSNFFSTVIASLIYSLIAMIFLKEKEDYASAMKEVEEDED